MRYASPRRMGCRSRAALPPPSRTRGPRRPAPPRGPSTACARSMVASRRASHIRPCYGPATLGRLPDRRVRRWQLVHHTCKVLQSFHACQELLQELATRGEFCNQCVTTRNIRCPDTPRARDCARALEESGIVDEIRQQPADRRSIPRRRTHSGPRLPGNGCRRLPTAPLPGAWA